MINWRAGQTARGSGGDAEDRAVATGAAACATPSPGSAPRSGLSPRVPTTITRASCLSRGVDQGLGRLGVEDLHDGLDAGRATPPRPRASTAVRPSSATAAGGPGTPRPCPGRLDAEDQHQRLGEPLGERDGDLQRPAATPATRRTPGRCSSARRPPVARGFAVASDSGPLLPVGRVPRPPPEHDEQADDEDADADHQRRPDPEPGLLGVGVRPGRRGRGSTARAARSAAATR